MITGTCHFSSLKSAIEYYAIQGIGSTEVKNKLGNKEIKIGEPKIRPDQRLSDQMGRYFIHE